MLAFNESWKYVDISESQSLLRRHQWDECVTARKNPVLFCLQASVLRPNILFPVVALADAILRQHTSQPLAAAHPLRSPAHPRLLD